VSVDDETSLVAVCFSVGFGTVGCVIITAVLDTCDGVNFDVTFSVVLFTDVLFSLPLLSTSLDRRLITSITVGVLVATTIPTIVANRRRKKTNAKRKCLCFLFAVFSRSSFLKLFMSLKPWASWFSSNPM